MPKVSLFTEEQTEIILEMYGRGCSDREIGERVERAPRQVAGKIDYLRRLGLLPDSIRAHVRWTAENVEQFVLAWNDPATTIDEMTTQFRRTVIALYRRATVLRDQGREMRHRGTASPSRDGAEWGHTRMPEFHTDKMFEDDPIAVLDMGSRGMPRKPDIYGSIGSSLYGAKVHSGSGRQGAAI